MNELILIVFLTYFSLPTFAQNNCIDDNLDSCFSEFKSDIENIKKTLGHLVNLILQKQKNT